MPEHAEDLHLAIPNDLTAFADASRALESFLEHRRVDPEAVFTATLVLEEAVTNVIKYAYQDARAHQILIDARVQTDTIEIRVTDDGRPFDPLAAAAPNFETPLEERPIGGLGIHLLRKLARRIEYQNVDGKNVLTLFLPLGS